MSTRRAADPWVTHVQLLAEHLRNAGFEPVVLRGSLNATARAAALARLDPGISDRPLLAVATGSYIGEGFDSPALDTLFLAAPIAFRGRLVQYVGRVLRPHPGKTTAEVHDYYDVLTGVLASSLAKRAPGYVSLGFPDPRRISTHARSSPPHPAPPPTGRQRTSTRPPIRPWQAVRT